MLGGAAQMEGITGAHLHRRRQSRLPFEEATHERGQPERSVAGLRVLAGPLLVRFWIEMLNGHFTVFITPKCYPIVPRVVDGAGLLVHLAMAFQVPERVRPTDGGFGWIWLDMASLPWCLRTASLR